MGHSILFVGKKDDIFCERALDFVQSHFSESVAVLCRRQDPFPGEFDTWHGDFVISYLSPWIIPAGLLDRAKKAAINFHPGPPEYPGIGCTNFSLYDGVKKYGITCHHMALEVDTGKIIRVFDFPIFQRESVLSLTQRSYSYLLVCFYEVIGTLLEGSPLPKSERQWTRKPLRRTELEELCRIQPEMDETEIGRRVRAVNYPGMPGAFVELCGRRFVFPPPKEAR